MSLAFAILALSLYLARKQGECESAVSFLCGVELAAQAIGELGTAKTISFLNNRLLGCRKQKSGRLVWLNEQSKVAA